MMMRYSFSLSQPGSFNSNIGSSVCAICQVGRYSVGLAPTSCTLCSAGQSELYLLTHSFSHRAISLYLSRSLVCLFCSTFSASPNAINCVACTPGESVVLVQ